MSAALADEVEISTEEPTVLYRLYATDGSLLYVGITVNLKARLAQHAGEKPWWPEVTRKTAALLSSRAEALEAEAAAIQAERPRHNVKGTVAPLDRSETPAQPQVAHIGHGPENCIFAQLLESFADATAGEVRQWHERMVATGTRQLGAIFADGWNACLPPLTSDAA